METRSVPSYFNYFRPRANSVKVLQALAICKGKNQTLCTNIMCIYYNIQNR